jgi:mono/diheme cytochrome c family protein
MSYSINKIFIVLILFSVSLVSYGDVFAVSNSKQLERGKLIYHKFCSRCHGKKLEGHPNWRVRKADGKLPAPPQDGSGHTWHHADELLLGIIKKGIVPPYGPENYKTDMPAWESTLSDDDIRAVLAFIKSKWPQEARDIQADINADSKKPFGGK